MGTGYSSLKIDYENEDGTVEKISMGDYIPRLFSASFQRVFALNNLLLPRFIQYIYMPSDFRYKRNANRLRSHIQNMINDRRKGKTHSYTEEAADLLSILLGTDFYQKNDDNLIIDEVFTFFFAGMKTI